MRSFPGIVAFAVLLVLAVFSILFSGSSDKKADHKTRISIGKILKEVTQ